MDNIERKQNAFRSSIRQNYIEKHFSQKRKQFALLHKNNHRQGSQQGSEDRKQDKIKQIFERLPQSINSLVVLGINEGSLVNEFIFNNIQEFVNSFAQLSLWEWHPYMYLIKSLIIQQKTGSAKRLCLIEHTLSKATYSFDFHFRKNKIEEFQTIKQYLQYMVTLGTDIHKINITQYYILIQYIKKIFLQFPISQEYEELYNLAMLILNNILIINHSQTSLSQYDVKFMKKELILKLYENMLLFKNIYIIALQNSNVLLFQQILRFFVNFTYYMHTLSEINRLFPGINIFILSIISQSVATSHYVPILLMRLINNIFVTDMELVDKLNEFKIIQQLLCRFSDKCLREQQINNIDVNEEVISFVYGYIDFVGIQHHSIGPLINKVQIHNIIVNKLQNMFINTQVIIKGLKILILLSNSEPQTVVRALSSHINHFDSLLLNKDGQVVNYSQSIINLITQLQQNKDYN